MGMRLYAIILILLYTSISATGWCQSTNGIQFIPDRSFGSTDDVLIGSIATFTVDHNNRVHIADGGQETVHVFDPDSGYITSLGREGRGPGEFDQISAFTLMKIHSNRLYVSDSNTNFIQRLQVYDMEEVSFMRIWEFGF